jgi:NADH dehydrogenase
LSLHPRKGGPKNLPIIEENLDDAEDDEKKAMSGKPRLVIVGGGWGVSDRPDCRPNITSC